MELCLCLAKFLHKYTCAESLMIEHQYETTPETPHSQPRICQHSQEPQQQELEQEEQQEKQSTKSSIPTTTMIIPLQYPYNVKIWTGR